MIHASELRIGNKVYDNVIGRNIQVDPNIIRDLYVCELAGKEFDKVSPISLTPEILKKAGFTERWQGSWETPFIEIEVDWKNGGYVLLNGEERSHWMSRYEYLHQLQNLYFALTGEELTVNL